MKKTFEKWGCKDLANVNTMTLFLHLCMILFNILIKKILYIMMLFHKIWKLFWCQQKIRQNAHASLQVCNVTVCNQTMASFEDFWVKNMFKHSNLTSVTNKYMH